MFHQIEHYIHLLTLSAQVGGLPTPLSHQIELIFCLLKCCREKKKPWAFLEKYNFGVPVVFPLLVLVRQKEMNVFKQKYSRLR